MVIKLNTVSSDYSVYLLITICRLELRLNHLNIKLSSPYMATTGVENCQSMVLKSWLSGMEA